MIDPYTLWFLLSKSEIVAFLAALVGALVGGLFTLLGVAYESQRRAEANAERSLETTLTILENDFLKAAGFALNFDREKLISDAIDFPEILIAKLEPLRTVAERSDRVHDLLTPIESAELRAELRQFYNRLGEAVNALIAREVGFVRLEGFVASSAPAITDNFTRLSEAREGRRAALAPALDAVRRAASRAIELRKRILDLRNRLGGRLRRKFSSTSPDSGPSDDVAASPAAAPAAKEAP